MPSLRDMFPSKYLQSEDLPHGRNTTVTIEKVYPGQARANNHGDEPEVKWMIRFREFRKPMTLWQSNAKMIASLLGSEDVDTWRGKQVNIYPSTYTSFGEVKPCINVDKFPVEAGRAPVGAIVPANDGRVVPVAAIERFLGHLKAAGKSWEDFLKWSRGPFPGVVSMAWGMEMGEIPAGVVPAMKAYLDHLVSTKPAELIDKTTGEVISPAAGPTQTPQVSFTPTAPPKTKDEISADDIPF